MGDPKKARAWDWAADAVEAAAHRELRRFQAFGHDRTCAEANRALDVVVPYLRKMAQRIESRPTWRDSVATHAALAGAKRDE